MRKIKGEMVATKKDYYQAILAAVEAGVTFGDLDMKTFAKVELDKLNKPRSNKVSEKVAAEQAAKDEIVFAAIQTFNAPKRVKAIAEAAEMSAQGATASLKRLVNAGKVVKTEFEGVSLYAVA